MTQDAALIPGAVAAAHRYWRHLLTAGDTVIDATCGNGHDTLFLADLVITSDEGSLLACDIQKRALDSARTRINAALGAPRSGRIQWRLGCHSSFPEEITHSSVRLVAYNLGYLPGSDKTVTTKKETTLQSLASAMELVAPGGAISIVCYPGHDAGAHEEERLVLFGEGLPSHNWCCCHHRWLNREKAPSLLLLEKLR